jgi:hypothetical protein
VHVRPWRRLATITMAMAVAWVVVAPGAWGHGAVGEIEVGVAELVDSLTVEFPIRITYANDGHPAEEVEGLVVSGKGPDGAEFGPLDAFTPGDAPGVYLARVEVPAEGTWELLVEVADPDASTVLTADATGPAVVAPDDAPDAEPPVGAAPPGDPDDPAAVDDDPAPADDLTDGAADDAAEDDETASNLVPILIAAVVAVAAAVVGYSFVRRRI